MSVDKMSVGQMSVDQMSVDQMVFDQKMWRQQRLKFLTLVGIIFEVRGAYLDRNCNGLGQLFDDKVPHPLQW
jgi:hypothetical protein